MASCHFLMSVDRFSERMLSKIVPSDFIIAEASMFGSSLITFFKISLRLSGALDFSFDLTILDLIGTAFTFCFGSSFTVIFLERNFNSFLISFSNWNCFW